MFRLTLGCVLLLICLTALPRVYTLAADKGSFDGDVTITVTLEETEEAFPNPMKGFRPTRHLQDAAFPEGEYVTVCKQYIKYTDLEMYADDTAQKMIDWSNKAWAGIENKNIKVIPRVVIVYPDGPDNGTDGYWPEGFDHSDFQDRWVNDTFKARMTAFIIKLGEAWNGDPRVAAIEMGLWGKWGEHHVWPLSIRGSGQRISREIQAVFGDAFTMAFPDKKIMVRYGETFPNHQFGFYWDSFALRDDSLSGKLMMERDAWRAQMISGEIAYDWGDLRPIGWNPDETLLVDEHTDYIIDWIAQTHASSLGWVADYTQGLPGLLMNAARMQKAFGYRFVIRQASYPVVAHPGEPFSVVFQVENAGNAPFYYPWPVELSLLNDAREPVFSAIVHVDIRNWLPGHTYEVRDTFTLPEGFQEGTYRLALAVLDPSGNLPSLRFANRNYYNGGRMPLGAIGVGTPPVSEEIGPFDSLYHDRSLHYAPEGGVNPPIEDRQTYPERDE